MSLWNNVKTEVLLKCKRYCCFCQKYCGRDIEVHHIIQQADGGKDIVDNAIPLCFGCHSEIGSYNPKHPKGNKYTPEELKTIRDAFYLKAENLSRRPNEIPESDSTLLAELKGDYTGILEYCIRKDFSSELIEIDLSDRIHILEFYKWSLKKYTFSTISLEELKIALLQTLGELASYVTVEYFKLHEPSGKIIYKNESWEEGCKLREELRPNTLRIRSKLKTILDTLYSY